MNGSFDPQQVPQGWLSQLTLPTRDFTLVIDPYCLEDLLKRRLRGALRLIADLMSLTPPVNIHLIFPEYLATDLQRKLAGRDRTPLRPLQVETGVPDLTLSRDLGRRVRERIQRGAEGDCRGLRLLALTQALKADGVVTSIPSLVEPRHHLLQHHKFRIVLPEELSDFVEVCARGHGISCAVLHGSPAWLPPDILYQFTHWKSRCLFEWFNRVSPTLHADGHVHELLRSALLNRYPFILHARDMVSFYRLQAHHYFRRGRQTQVFREPLNYHLTAFYTHIWGMLDTLAQIANARLALEVNVFRCHINRDDFLEPLGAKCPGLRRFIRRHGGQWVAIIGDVRHPVAHSALRLQRDVAVDTEESRKSDEEIAAILRQEDPEFYRLFPADLIEAWESFHISHWRISKMKVISDDAIYVEQAEGGYFRPPVASLDYDLERLNAFIDAFLIACFAKPDPAGTVEISTTTLPG